MQLDTLLELLRGGHAHTTFADAVKNLPFDKTGIRPRALPYSAWELVEHMRIAQNDILRFSREPDYVSPQWPEGYWPASRAPKDEAHWKKSIAAFRRDLTAFERLLRERADEIDKPFPWGQGQTLLREALLIADHNSYHIGQLVLLRRLLDTWKG
jgi:uncharacterized damage-inducible protein DinB